MKTFINKKHAVKDLYRDLKQIKRGYRAKRIYLNDKEYKLIENKQE